VDRRIVVPTETGCSGIIMFCHLSNKLPNTVARSEHSDSLLLADIEVEFSARKRPLKQRA
jgi:hypothetical protein